MGGIILSCLKRVVFFSSIMSMLVFMPAAYSSPWEIEPEIEPAISGFWKIRAKITSWDIYNTTPNPLYNCEGNACYVYIIHRSIWGLSTPPQMSIYVPEARGIKTLGELGDFLRRRGDLNWTYVHNLVGGDTSMSCVFLGYPNQGQGGSAYIPMPGGKDFCQVKVSPTYCGIYMPNAELRHGSLSSDKVNGNIARTSLYVRCTGNLQARLMSADHSSNIFFKGVGGFRSELKLDGTGLGEGKVVNVTPAGVSLTLTSTLAGYDGSIGTFRGSKTIIIVLP